MSTYAQRQYIGSLLYKSGMGFNASAKVQDYCEGLTDTQASTVISYLKAHGMDDLDMYEDDEVVPERIKDILEKSFTY